MANYYGIIYLSYRSLKLKIIDLKKMTTLETVVADIPPTVAKNHVFTQELDTIIRGLHGFKQILKETGVTSFKMWANGQLLEPMTAAYLGEQIFTQTGFTIHWLNENQLIYLKAIGVLESLDEQIISDPSFYLLNFGSSSITISKFAEQTFHTNWNFTLDEQLNHEVISSSTNTTANAIEILDDIIGSDLISFRNQFPFLDAGHTLIVQDANFLNRIFLDKKGVKFTKLSSKKFLNIYEKVLYSPNQYLEEKYHIPLSEQTNLVARLILLKRIIALTKVKKIYLTSISAMTGLALAEGIQSHLLKRNYDSMIVSAAQYLAARYDVDLNHCHNVIHNALHLFDQTQKIHHLGHDERLLLELAGYLSDIGNFIGHTDHFNHSAYIITASKLLGLSQTQIQIIAEVARLYNLQTSRQQINERLAQIPPSTGLIIAKLVAILRLAGALDAAFEQKVTKTSISLKANTLIVTAYSTDDLTLEKWTFNRSANLFTTVFGIRPQLKQRMIVNKWKWKINF